jgi:hypothetical protein
MIHNDQDKPEVVFYQGSQPFNELELPPEPEAEADDYDWAMQNPQLRQEYGGLVVAVRQHKVWGVGKNQRAAREQARQTPDCPPIEEMVFVVIPGMAPEIRGTVHLAGASTAPGSR